MHRTRVKICGITRAEDALAAARAGADAVGMVFHEPAPRSISLERAREILAVLGPFVTPVGLFVDAPPARIRKVAAALGLRAVQLHGHETPEQVAELAEFNVIKAVRVEADRLAGELAVWRRGIDALGLPNLRGLVLETPTPQAGGSGIENDWQTIRRHQLTGDFADLPPIIAAGGLGPQNVAHIVRSLRPWAVDISSGVERVRGEKSPELIEAFITAVRKADDT